MEGMDKNVNPDKVLEELTEQVRKVCEKQKVKRLTTSWRDNFDDRQLREIEFCRIYRNDFGHGTDGHILRILVAELSMLLDNKDPMVKE